MKKSKEGMIPAYRHTLVRERERVTKEDTLKTKLSVIFNGWMFAWKKLNNDEDWKFEENKRNYFNIQDQIMK